MKRQLYYLLPDVMHTHEVYEDLKGMDIPDSQIHAVMEKKCRIDGIRDVHSLNERDYDYFIEWFLWRLNLALFGFALIVLVGMAIWELTYYLFIPLAVMLTTFLTGLYFTLRVPNVHWNEFISSLHHGEVLLIVDVPTSGLYRVDHVIRQRHPEAIRGGVCWKA